MESTTIILIILAVWLLLVTGALVAAAISFARLTKGVKEGNLIKVLEAVVTGQKTSQADVAKLTARLGNLEKDIKVHIQKIGLVRFNPFKETGGDHSFSLALLNANNTGVVITGLHTRDRTRIYIKPVTKSVSELKLSKEELKAIEQAK